MKKFPINLNAQNNIIVLSSDWDWEWGWELEMGNGTGKVPTVPGDDSII